MEQSSALKKIKHGARWMSLKTLCAEKGVRCNRLLLSATYLYEISRKSVPESTSVVVYSRWDLLQIGIKDLLVVMEMFLNSMAVRFAQPCELIISLWWVNFYDEVHHTLIK